jgi:hypothetical protein
VSHFFHRPLAAVLAFEVVAIPKRLVHRHESEFAAVSANAVEAIVNRAGMDGEADLLATCDVATAPSSV